MSSAILTTARGRMMVSIQEFMLYLETVPGWKEWNRHKIEYALSFEDSHFDQLRNEMVEEFSFPAKVERQHAVVIGFLTLVEGVDALKECEYYFRRYPFRGLPVPRYRHVVNICEMYFSRFYEIRERLRNVLNAVNFEIAPKRLDVGKFIKKFDKVFEEEIRARHGVHHRERFYDVATSRMFLAEVVASTHSKEHHLARGHRAEYRRLVNEWVERVRRRGKLMDEFLEVVARAIVENCHFLDQREQR